MKKNEIYTQQYESLVDALRCEVKLRTRNVVVNDSNDQGTFSQPLHAIWDTGADRSAISSTVARKLKWKKLAMKYLSTANGVIKTDAYYVDLQLPNGIMVEGLEILGVNLDASTDVLIGMDVIKKGDFAISNADKHTVYSYRKPSGKVIDFEEMQTTDD